MTTAFTDDEITTCPAGASLICIKTVVMNEDRTVTFTKGKEYKVVTASRYVLGLTNNLGAPHLINPRFMREHLFDLDHRFRDSSLLSQDRSEVHADVRPMRFLVEHHAELLDGFRPPGQREEGAPEVPTDRRVARVERERP